MEQPVQVGLVFPRSGQQLLVTVSARSAEHIKSQYSERNAPRVITTVNSRITRSTTDNDAHR